LAEAASTRETVSQSAQIEVLLAWGKYALDCSRFAEAEARFREVLKLDWNNPPAFDLLQETRTRRSEILKNWIRSGWAAEAAGNLAQAEQRYQRVLDESPDYRAAINGMARLRRHREADRYVRAGLEKYIQEDYPGAEMDFEHALSVDPSDETALLYRDQVQQQVTKSTGLADLRSDAPTWTKYLDALKKLRAGDLEGAERLWREILQAYPGNEAVLSNLEQVTRRRKQEFSSQGMAP
jgi:tetratricopeptide (TPR) repeat protein